MPETSSREAALAALARRLGDAWLGCSRIAELQDAEIPKNRAEAYFVADRMALQIGEDISGWKVGATMCADARAGRAQRRHSRPDFQIGHMGG